MSNGSKSSTARGDSCRPILLSPVATKPSAITPKVNDLPLPRFPTTAITCSLVVDSQTWGCLPDTASAKVPNKAPSPPDPPAPTQIPPRGGSIVGLIRHSVVTAIYGVETTEFM